MGESSFLFCLQLFVSKGAVNFATEDCIMHTGSAVRVTQTAPLLPQNGRAALPSLPQNGRPAVRFKQGDEME